MDHNETDRLCPGTELVPVETPRARLGATLAARAPASPAFVSQLLAARARLPAQRTLRRADPADARIAYVEAGRRGIRRVPQGFYSTRIV